MIKTAVIICGGLGSRLVLTGFNRPKSLISVSGQALIDIQFKFLVESGFKKVVLAMGHGSEEILKHLSNSPITSRIEVISVVEDSPRGTGGALLALQEHVEDDFFVFYGDILIDIYMGRIMQGNRGSLASIITRRSDHICDSDIVQADHERKLTNFLAKPHPDGIRARNIAATGMFLFSLDSLIELRKRFGDSPFSLDRDGVKYLLEQGFSIGTMPAVGLVQDLGTMERMRNADEIWQRHRSNLIKKPAIFFDRDGTLNHHRGHLSQIEEFEVYEDVPQSIARLKELGYFIFVITNQPVLARGEASWNRVEEIHLELDEFLEKSGDTFIDEIFVCPHHPDSGFAGEVTGLKKDCQCRKPNTGLIERCIDNYPVDLERSWVVGDTWRDLELAKNAKLNFAGVRSSELKEKGKAFFIDIREFVNFLEKGYALDNI